MEKKFEIKSLVTLIIGGLLSVAAMIFFSTIIASDYWDNQKLVASILFIYIFGIAGFVATAIFLIVTLVTNRKSKNKIINILAIVFLVGYVAVPVISYGVTTIVYDAYYTFSIDKWKKSDPEDRRRLLDSLLSKLNLQSFSRAQVEEHLGQPDLKEGVNDATYLYDIGKPIGEIELFTKYNYYLRIDFDESNMVTSYNRDYKVAIPEN